MSEHFSLRLPSGTADRLRRHADRTSLAPRTLAQRYIEEGLRRDDHPLIRFADGPAGRRAALVRGPDVWEIINVVRANANDVKEAAEYLALPVEAVQAAVTYYGEFPTEIDEWIASNDAEFERGLAAYEAGLRALRA